MSSPSCPALHQLLDDAELLLDASVGYQLDAETLRHHRQLCQCPGLPGLGVVARFLQRTEVAEGPRHLIAVTFHIPIVGAVCPQDACYIPSHARFLCDADNHILNFRAKVRIVSDTSKSLLGKVSGLQKACEQAA